MPRSVCLIDGEETMSQTNDTTELGIDELNLVAVGFTGRKAGGEQQEYLSTINATEPTTKNWWDIWLGR